MDTNNPARADLVKRIDALAEDPDADPAQLSELRAQLFTMDDAAKKAAEVPPRKPWPQEEPEHKAPPLKPGDNNFKSTT